MAAGDGVPLLTCDGVCSHGGGGKDDSRRGVWWPGRQGTAREGWQSLVDGYGCLCKALASRNGRSFEGLLVNSIAQQQQATVRDQGYPW